MEFVTFQKGSTGHNSTNLYNTKETDTENQENEYTEVFSWGADKHGQLGIGNEVDHNNGSGKDEQM